MAKPDVPVQPLAASGSAVPGDRSTAAVLARGSDEDSRREAASLMGGAKTERKAETARQNGRRGGRPKGTPMSDEARENIRQGRLAAEARKREAKT